MEAYRGAITNIESGGRYDLLGPIANSSGDRAYGRYQVMGANVGPWTEEALGYRMTPQQFLADPAAQDAVFDHVFGGYVDRYGPDGAARAWFTGSPTGTGTDVLGTTADAYVAMFNGGRSGQPSSGSMPSGGGAQAQGGGYQSAPAWSPPNDQERAALRAMIANPLTREQGIALATQRMTPPEPVGIDPIEINGQLVDRNSGRVLGDYRDQTAGGAEWQPITDPTTGWTGRQNVQTGDVEWNPAGMQPQDATADPAVAPGALRTEIRQLQSYKNYYESLPIYQSMLAAAGTDDKAADLNLVYGLAKIFDPTSVVREGEQVLVRNAAGLPDQLVGWINGLNGGAALQPPVRAAIMEQARSRVDAYQNDLRNQLDFYNGIATRAGIDTADLYAPLTDIQSWQTPQAATPPPGSGFTRVPDGAAGDAAAAPPITPADITEENIAATMRANNLSRAQAIAAVAERMGVTPAEVARILEGQR